MTASGQTASGQSITLTLDQVVNYAINTNTNVILARQRLAEAGEGINEINAQGKPQLNSNVADTYSTFAESSSSFGPVVSNPSVPTGTTIPTVTDQAADFSSAFGLGSYESSGSAFGGTTAAPLGATGTSSTLPAANSAAPGSSSSTALPGINSGTSTSGATGTMGASGPSSPVTTRGLGSSIGPATLSTGSIGLNAPGTTPGNTGAAGSSSNSAPGASGAAYQLTPMPLILQNYVTETSAPRVVADEVAQTSTTTTSGSGPARTAELQSANSKSSDVENNAQATTATTSTVANQVVGKETVNNYGARVNLSQYIDAFGILGAARDVEKLTTNFYDIDIDRTQNEVALSAKNLFFNVVLAQQQVATEQEQVNDSRESVRVTAALVEQGQAAGFDLLSAQTTLANNQQLLTSAQNQLSFAVANLDYLLGINADTPINLVEPPIPSLDQQIDLSQTTNVALQRRPEILQANQNIVIAQKLVKVASEGLTPSIGIVGTYGYNSNATLTGPNNEGLVSAQVAIPFDDGGATRARVRNAKDVLQGQVTTRDEEKLNVTLEVRQAYLNILTAQTEAKTAQGGVDLAVETLRVANVQYQNGLGTILDVENAQAQLATARTNLANAQYSYQTALATLVRDIGSR